MKYAIYTITAILLILFLREIDYALLWAQIDVFGFRILGVIAISFVAYLCGALAWMFSINKVIQPQYLGRFFIVRQIGEALTTVNPTGVIAGDAIKIYLMSKVGYNPSEISQSVIVSRLLTWVAYLLVLLFVLVFLIAGFFPLAHTFLVVVFVSAMMILLLLSLFHKGLWIHRAAIFISKLSRSTRLKNRLSQVKEYNQDIHKLKNERPQYVVIALGLLVLHYLMGGVEYYYILSILGEDISFLSALSMEIGSSLLRSIMCFIPGQIGVEEYGNKYFLSLLNIKDEGTWVIVSILRRIRQIWWILFGVSSYIFYTRKANNIKKLKIAKDGYIIY
jgi:uncharacterized protein (TIRG00374 family)